VILQVSTDIEGIGRMLACYAAATRDRARTGRVPAPRRRRVRSLRTS
jgi:hypothetical protein